ncbi:MAG TPA: J domain-containing protein [Candidatus Acidoferrales bacterium]|nr:J domain-containing protein [Candidatus Acidoferrales bacterium]
MPRVKDYYEVLGVPRTASQKEISAAFRKLARKYHPDANAGDKAAETRFKELSQANDVLSDPAKRKLYDSYGPDWQAAQAAGARPGAGVHQRTVSPEEFADLFGGQSPFGDNLGDILGSVFAGGRRGRRPAAEAETVLPISLAEAYRGTSRMVELPDGRRVEVKVPAGVTPGTLLRVPGLLARVEVAPDPSFQIDGRDLRTVVAVPLAVALLGGEVEVPTPKGTRVNLKVPPETQNGTRLRLRGLGLPGHQGAGAGDLYAEVRVKLPVPLDEDGRRWAAETPR